MIRRGALVASAALLFWMSNPSMAACTAPASLDPLEVRSAQQVRIHVCPDRVVRESLPDTFFGFNVQQYGFEQDIWDTERAAVPDSVIADLSRFPGALYRYPGGLVSNRFAWQYSVGPLSERPIQKAVKWDAAGIAHFGLDEYLDFVAEVRGHPWFVLNLAGWDEAELFPELDSATIARTNADLAGHMLGRLGLSNIPRYYQLGNELDRADYQWSHDKYVSRSLETIKAMQKVDPDARFVAFLREFNWSYKGSEASRGTSQFRDFIRDVLNGLPMVNDFSMHFYYDARNGDKEWQAIPWRLKQFRRAIVEARKHRDPDDLKVWITEHARGIVFGKDKARDVEPYTSNLSAAISTADFLTALTQLPEVQGTAWHGLNAMPWRLFDPNDGLQANPVYSALRVLRQTDLSRVVTTYTTSPNISQYKGGYDVRATAFSNVESTKLAVWVVNRSVVPVRAELRVEGWENRRVTVQHDHFSGTTGVNPDDLRIRPGLVLLQEREDALINSDGVIMLTIPAASVSSFSLGVK